MSTLLHDLRLARRLLVKNPVFTTIVILTLALGIGLNTAVFSAIDALLLRPLPGVREPERLVQLYRTGPGSLYGSNNIPHYRDVRDRSGEVFSGVAAWSFAPLNLSVSGQSQRVYGMMVSANYFSVLGVTVSRGRTFVPDEDVGRGAHPVVVLSHSGWKGVFGGDPAIVGRLVILNGQQYTVIGVAAADFKSTISVMTPTLWVPLMQLDQVRPGLQDEFENRGDNFLNLVARLKPVASLAQANDRMTALSIGFEEEHPDDYKDRGIQLVLQSDAGIHPTLKGAQVGLASVVMAVVLVLLLIACVNVANLLLARARDRSREMAIRLSLGASRAVIIRQLLTESLVMAAAAGLVGLGLAWWIIGLANRVSLPMDADFTADLRLSPSVLLFTLGVSTFTGILFGLAPALQATRPALIPALKGETPAGESRSRMSRGLVVAQMALSIILLVCAGLFVRNLEAATEVDKGFVSDNVLLAEMDPGLQGYTRARIEDFYRRLRERLRTMPAVRAVGFAEYVQLGLPGSDWGVRIPGYVPALHESMSINENRVSPEYFEAMGIPILRGRGFTAQDDSAAAPVIVVNHYFAEHFWPHQDPLGRTVHTAGRDHAVIGVTPTGKYKRLGEDPMGFMFLAQAQHWATGMTIHVRTFGDPGAIGPVLRSAVSALDPNLPVSNVRSLNSHLGIALLPARIAGSVLGLFGALGTILASIGIYGVMSHSVSQRRREIGIRMAIGAAGQSVVRLLMREGLLLVLVGTGIGLVGALAAAQLIRGILYGGSVLDLVSFVGIPLMLVGVAMLAIWIPARRASLVDPVAALRQE